MLPFPLLIFFFFRCSLIFYSCSCIIICVSWKFIFIETRTLHSYLVNIYAIASWDLMYFMKYNRFPSFLAESVYFFGGKTFTTTCSLKCFNYHKTLGKKLQKQISEFWSNIGLSSIAWGPRRMDQRLTASGCGDIRIESRPGRRIDMKSMRWSKISKR